MTQSERVSKMAALAASVPADRLAVIYNGDEPRMIGTVPDGLSSAERTVRADALLISQRLSATFCSLAQASEGSRRFVVCHS